MREAPQTARTVRDEAHEFAAAPRREIERLAASLLAPRRRAVLATLRRAGSLPLTELAARVAAREQGTSPGDVSADRHDRVHVSLHHTHVPKLVDAGVLERDRDDETMVVRPTAAAREGGWVEAVDAAVRAEGSGEAVTTLLSDPRRARVTALLEGAGALALEDLARAVADAEAAAGDGPADGDEPAERDVTSVAVSLHHSHLPKLAAAGVVEYDTEERQVAVANVPDAFRRVMDRSAADGPAAAASVPDGAPD